MNPSQNVRKLAHVLAFVLVHRVGDVVLDRLALDAQHLGHFKVGRPANQSRNDIPLPRRQGAPLGHTRT